MGSMAAVLHYTKLANEAQHLALQRAAQAGQPTPAESFNPIRRAPALTDVLAQCDALTEQASAQFPQHRASVRVGVLEAKLAEVLRLFETTESDLLVELHTALQETCNGYHDDGHAARVERAYGLRVEAL